jgi:hypothetical protein
VPRRNVWLLLLLPGLAMAQTPAPAPEVRLDPGDQPLDITVVAQRLNAARTQILPNLGASRTDFSPDALAAIPQGKNAPLNQVMLQAPGVAQDSLGQLHVRGDHANLQYRIDGVQLPEGLTGFGQTLATRYAESIALITGALPAQYGFRQAGVVEITLPSGAISPGNEISLYGGARGYFQPRFTTAGHVGNFDWFVTGQYLQTQLGIENPTSSFNAIHDFSSQWYGLAKLTQTIDADTRISLILASARGEYQIPNNPGQTPQFTVNGVSDFDSVNLNEHQRQITQFGVVSLQKHVGDVDMQISAFTRYSDLYFTPDPLGDLIFTGNAQTAHRSSWASGASTKRIRCVPAI